MLSQTTPGNRLRYSRYQTAGSISWCCLVPGRGQGGLRDGTFAWAGSEDERQPKATSGHVGWGEAEVTPLLAREEKKERG